MTILRHPPPVKASDAIAEPPPPPPLHAVVVLRKLSPTFDAALSARFRLLKPLDSPLPLDAFLASHAAPRAAIVSAMVTVDASLLGRLPALRCLFTTSAGVDHIDLPECARRGVAVANAGAIFSVDVADCAVGLLIDVLRRVSASDQFVRHGLWPIKGNYPLGSKWDQTDRIPRASLTSFTLCHAQLGGKRVGIIGLGSIGTEIAKRLEAFGCIIFYHSRRAKPSFSYKYFSNVDDLASQCDVLVVSCALTSETQHIVNKKAMQALGKDGVVINISRGDLIDEEELVRCLVRGEVGGAGLDVFKNEPSVPKELFAMDNVVLSPHAAVHTEQSLADMLRLMIGNLEAFFANKPLITPVSV